MIRPEIKATLYRWSEAFWATAAIGFAAWLFTRGGWLMQGLGVVFGLAAFGMLLIALRRGRFNPGTGGPGVVQLDEGRIRYFGPFHGGAVSVVDMVRLELEPTSSGQTLWLLHSPGQPALAIPLAAQGGAQLYDAFANLPGIDMAHVSDATRAQPDHRVTLWCRDTGNALTLR